MHDGFRTEYRKLCDDSTKALLATEPMIGSIANWRDFVEPNAGCGIVILSAGLTGKFSHL